MKKYVFGLGSAQVLCMLTQPSNSYHDYYSLIDLNNWQVLATTAAVGVIAHRFAALPGPAAIVVGSGLALSSTAVVLQVLP